MLLYDQVSTDWGGVLVAMDEKGVKLVRLYEGTKAPVPIFNVWKKSPAKLKDATDQLKAYFAGELKVFDLPLSLEGTPFQLQVWEALRKIPYGETRSYMEMALSMGNDKACRAVGGANGRNPIPVIIPCHRVVGSNGTLGGYSGGLGLKKRLLSIEGISLDSFEK
ncbi:methylated-DNA--[protein]-cysteine S-methyltransferase [Dethiosulfovibrio salsuginis]|uniref:Methylated-DNA--protein-cysteine methyltransferase n=1 Tax=Dethiosulfovibrio salsuginis TaxID=561720 RepID=A0A1X7J6M8_9BACT|nr:methylated-DNA--[protein]-cysteine S-methyltransferase [Dethiosulfovibrio salsuginis]SMG23393.1 methylated-DNA-[protein]-cysteine S-methyltransferase [Dethiosulfovibrio salsuginis]